MTDLPAPEADLVILFSDLEIPLEGTETEIKCIDLTQEQTEDLEISCINLDQELITGLTRKQIEDAVVEYSMEQENWTPVVDLDPNTSYEAVSLPFDLPAESDPVQEVNVVLVDQLRQPKRTSTHVESENRPRSVGRPRKPEEWKVITRRYRNRRSRIIQKQQVETLRNLTPFVAPNTSPTNTIHLAASYMLFLRKKGGPALEQEWLRMENLNKTNA